MDRYGLALGDFFQGEEVLRTKSQRAAIAKFNELRREMEARFPARELSPEDKARVLREMVLDAQVGHATSAGRKKTSAGSTRTFGG